MKSKGKFTVLALALLLAAASRTAWAAQTSVAITVTANNSTGGVTPTTAGVNYFYDYEISAGSSITDSLPVRICAAASVSRPSNPPPATAAYPTSVSFANNGDLPGVTAPANFSFQEDGCQNVSISINTGAMNTEGDFARVVIVNGSGPVAQTQVTVDTPNIHIRVKVTAANATSCFITDSSFGFLLDCNGNVINSGFDGRFAIVTNKKNVEVATNPGQFYYNVLWTNTTGSDKTVKVTFGRSGVNPQGAQAIHAKVFPSFPAIDALSFSSVNDDIPSGSDDMLEGVFVPAGWTLWVDYHLDYAGRGGPAPGDIATSCESANQDFGVLAAVTEVGSGASLGECGAGASGYKK